mmetsp:Transcript_13325/g.26795  ORF Transcript_13325/g.26795 Transcript_13325/m.26795 type:complete len:258 (-) Transcript_13325:320-1093(-)
MFCLTFRNQRSRLSLGCLSSGSGLHHNRSLIVQYLLLLGHQKVTLRLGFNSAHQCLHNCRGLMSSPQLGQQRSLRLSLLHANVGLDHDCSCALQLVCLFFLLLLDELLLHLLCLLTSHFGLDGDCGLGLNLLLCLRLLFVLCFLSTRLGLHYNSRLFLLYILLLLQYSLLLFLGLLHPSLTLNGRCSCRLCMLLFLRSFLLLDHSYLFLGLFRTNLGLHFGGCIVLLYDELLLLDLLDFGLRLGALGLLLLQYLPWC